MTVINNQMRRTGQRFSFTCVYRESSVGVETSQEQEAITCKQPESTQITRCK